MRRTTLFLLLAGSLALLGTARCQPNDVRDPRTLVVILLGRVGALEDMLRDTKQAVCKLYGLTGNESMLPRFCPRPPGPCDQPIERGPCQAVIPRYGFDADTGQCARFVYGGCQGNDNNFETLAECERACEEPPSVCDQPIDPGPCDGAFPRWSFDAGTGRCARFVYGGCQGNGNNFETLEACESACPADPIPLCDLPPDAGPCEAAIPRWYHDAGTGQCERFLYGGCQGNANNFATAAECEQACVRDDVCSLPPEIGPCRGSFARWYHDAETGQCERFIYGGCQGNANNFATLARCERTCPRCTDDLCREHQECRLYRDPACPDHVGCVRPFCADVCDPGACAPGNECRLVDVQCVTAPCPPIRECIPSDACSLVRCGFGQKCDVTSDGRPYCYDTCESIDCAPDQKCVLEPVVCVTEPCPPLPVCVDLQG